MPGQKNFIALEATSQEILRRVTKIDLATSTVVSGNPYEIGFSNISDLLITGTWDQSNQRIAF